MAKEFRTKDKSKWVDSQDFKVPTSSGQLRKSLEQLDSLHAPRGSKISSPYEDGFQALGVGHLRKRSTNKEITRKSITDKISGNTIHVPGKNFDSTQKANHASLNNPSRPPVEIETGVSQKSIRTFQNIQTQTNLKVESCDKAKLAVILGID